MVWYVMVCSHWMPSVQYSTVQSSPSWAVPFRLHYLLNSSAEYLVFFYTKCLILSCSTLIDSLIHVYLLLCHSFMVAFSPVTHRNQPLFQLYIMKVFYCLQPSSSSPSCDFHPLPTTSFLSPPHRRYSPSLIPLAHPRLYFHPLGLSSLLYSSPLYSTHLHSTLLLQEPWIRRSGGVLEGDQTVFGAPDQPDRNL